VTVGAGVVPLAALSGAATVACPSPVTVGAGVVPLAALSGAATVALPVA